MCVLLRCIGGVGHVGGALTAAAAAYAFAVSVATTHTTHLPL